jgi:hypothetical protein
MSPALPWAARPAYAGPHPSSASIDQHGSVSRVRLTAQDIAVSPGPGLAVYLVLVRAPHPDGHRMTLRSAVNLRLPA